MASMLNDRNEYLEQLEKVCFLVIRKICTSLSENGSDLVHSVEKLLKWNAIFGFNVTFVAIDLALLLNIHAVK